MNVLYLILLILALACFVASAARVASARVNLMAAGLALWVLVPVIQVARNLN